MGSSTIVLPADRATEAEPAALAFVPWGKVVVAPAGCLFCGAEATHPHRIHSQAQLISICEPCYAATSRLGTQRWVARAAVGLAGASLGLLLPHVWPWGHPVQLALLVALVVLATWRLAEWLLLRHHDHLPGCWEDGVLLPQSRSEQLGLVGAARRPATRWAWLPRSLWAHLGAGGLAILTCWQADRLQPRALLLNLGVAPLDFECEGHGFEPLTPGYAEHPHLGRWEALPAGWRQCRWRPVGTPQWKEERIFVHPAQLTLVIPENQGLCFWRERPGRTASDGKEAGVTRLSAAPASSVLHLPPETHLFIPLPVVTGPDWGRDEESSSLRLAPCGEKPWQAAP